MICATLGEDLALAALYGPKARPRAGDGLGGGIWCAGATRGRRLEIAA